MPLVLESLRTSDLPEVCAIEQEAFTAPWSASLYERELQNRLAHYFVLREENGTRRILGYAGLSFLVDEAHLMTIAVRKEERGRGYGELLLTHAIATASARGVDQMTLEVRVSNTVAQALYRKYGFAIVGRRKRYYVDPPEDALLMTVTGLTQPGYQARFAALRQALAARLGAQLTVAEGA
jgi:ribosomal-protein-alanine N-acetyltransferase